MELPCISLWQPWAQLVAEGLKTIETRTHNRFKGLYGVTIAIHAARQFDYSFGFVARPWMAKEAKEIAEGKITILNRGVIICTAFVNGYTAMSGGQGRQFSQRAMINCGEGFIRYGLFLTDIRKLEHPIPVKGRQGIFNVEIPDEEI